MINVEQIVEKHKFKYKKSLGQNFIFDEDLLDEIAVAGGADGACVVEIGAGAGSLTRAIAKRCKRVCAFEIDQTLFPVLEETLAEFDNVTLFSNNVLELGAECVDMLVGEKYVVIANLPYYVTSPMINLFLRSSDCTAVTCLVQKEVADRICAESGGDFGALTAAVRSVSEPRRIREIKSWEFTPMPEVDSALIRLDRKDGEVYTDQREAFFNMCFTQKRKTLVNNLVSAGIDKERIVGALQSLGYSQSARAEQLGAQGLLDIGKLLGKID